MADVHWLLKILFAQYVCVSTPEAINYICMVLNLHNKFNKLAKFQNIKQFYLRVRP